MSEKPWDGRFSEKTDQMVETFTSSIQVDSRLYAADIDGSIAHCKTLIKAGVLTEDEGDSLIGGLATVRHELERGEFVFSDELEDIHMHIESRLGELIGKTAHKLHTGRSRNDQVATDTRLYLRAETDAVITLLHELRTRLVELAEKNQDVYMPGYTHLQRAQPVLLAHHLLAYYEMFTRDAMRFADCRKRINVLPLGSAALAGTTFPIDRSYTAELLDFPEISANSMDAVSDRDFVLEFLAAASIAMTHLSRISEELILWSSAEFGFLKLPDAFATGSSIMPQKKNPDVAELVRGKTGSVFGALMNVLTLMKGLPLAYNRDMQEDKPPLFLAVDTLKSSIAIYARMIPRLGFCQEKMKKAASTGYLNATDLADYLVEKGVPFRQAHGYVGKAVAYALDQKKELEELSLKELKTICKEVEEDIFAALSVEAVVDHRKSAGGTALANVMSALKVAQNQLKDEL